MDELISMYFDSTALIAKHQLLSTEHIVVNIAVSIDTKPLSVSKRSFSEIVCDFGDKFVVVYYKNVSKVKESKTKQKTTCGHNLVILKNVLNQHFTNPMQL